VAGPGVLVPGTTATVRVPASSANLGPGFDSIGLALELWDECTATVTDEPGLRISVEGQGADDVPRDASHLVYRTMVIAWQERAVRIPSGLRLECTNRVPHGRGLGSSATAIVMGIVAAQALERASASIGAGDNPDLDLAWANNLASRIEGHPDNASASVFGGLTLSWSDDPGLLPATSTLRLPVHPDVTTVVFVPTEQLSTARARAVLPTHVRHANAALNSARAALLVHAMGHDPAYLLSATREWLHQEPRRASYPASMALVDRLRAAGHAAVISGAGPSVLVLTTGAERQAVAAVGDGPGWSVLQPGIPASGASWVRT
jgi:homoserine kinase